MIRTIVDTQENERIRFAKDLHDSLGQQLSAVKFYLGTLINSNDLLKSNLILSKSNDALTTVLHELRNICFNLMPKTLEIFGLVEAVNELCRKTEFKGQLEFNINADKKFPSLNKPLEIAIFRIAQEFINNAIKHGKATEINMFFKYEQPKNRIKIELKENGLGFVPDQALNAGMGLKNVRSRIQSYRGEVKIYSSPGKGTEYTILIPLTKELQQDVQKTTNQKTMLYGS